MAQVDTSFYPKAPQGNAMLDAAAGYMGLMNSAEQNKLLQTQNQQSQRDLVNSQVGTLVNVFSGLAADPNLSFDKIRTVGGQLVQQGLIDPKQLEVEMGGINPSSDQGALREAMTGYALRALSAGERFNAQFGSPQMIQTGNAQLPVTVSPLTGIAPLGGAIPNTMSPAQLAAPTQIGVTPEGQPIMGTQGQFMEQAGVNPLTGRGPAPQMAQNPLMGQQPQMMEAQESQPQQPPMPAPRGAGVVTTLPAGAVEAMTQAGSKSGSELANAQAREVTYAQEVAPLEKAIPSLEALGTTGTGPGTEQINEIFSFLQSMGVPGLDKEKIKDFDTARKYLVQYAQASGNANTNDKLAAAFAGNPSVGISNAAAVDVAKTALALRRLQNASVRSFNGSPEQYLKFATDFNATQDPRAYGFDMMSPEQRAAMIGEMNDVEKTMFVRSLRNAVELGLVRPPAQGGASGQ